MISFIKKAEVWVWISNIIPMSPTITFQVSMQFVNISKWSFILISCTWFLYTWKKKKKKKTPKSQKLWALLLHTCFWNYNSNPNHTNCTKSLQRLSQEQTLHWVILHNNRPNLSVPRERLTWWSNTSAAPDSCLASERSGIWFPGSADIFFSTLHSLGD